VGKHDLGGGRGAKSSDKNFLNYFSTYYVLMVPNGVRGPLLRDRCKTNW
jgi:hypothetical protein